jgi:hypothetical protein
MVELKKAPPTGGGEGGHVVHFRIGGSPLYLSEQSRFA